MERISPVRIAVLSFGLACVSLALGVSSQGMCGCPAQCSPLVCVKVQDCDWEQPDVTVCRWSKCGGVKWTTPGPVRVLSTGWLLYQCVTRDGSFNSNGVCVPNQVGGNEVFTTVNGASVTASEPCNPDE